jgi:uncharacterized membrane protein YphA (DoxX/SURF4 family)
MGVYVFGAASIAAGIMNIAWGEFEPAHQPIQAWGDQIPGLTILAYIAAIWLIAGGAAMLWSRTRRFGAAALGILYGIFVLFPLPRLYTAPHFMGHRADVYISVLASICQLVILFVAAVVAWDALSAPGPLSQKTAMIARCAFGLSSVIFGLAHLTAVQTVVPMIPKWMPLGGTFWTVLTGIAFVLAGLAIVAGVLDVLAARLLALMLLVFSLLVLAPHIFSSPHNHIAWGGNAYNLTAVGAAWIVSDWLATRKQSIHNQRSTKSAKCLPA